MSKPLPTRARIIIIGGGVMGRCIADNEATLDWRDVVLSQLKRRI